MALGPKRGPRPDTPNKGPIALRTYTRAAIGQTRGLGPIRWSEAAPPLVLVTRARKDVHACACKPRAGSRKRPASSHALLLKTLTHIIKEAYEAERRRQWYWRRALAVQSAPCKPPTNLLGGRRAHTCYY